MELNQIILDLIHRAKDQKVALLLFQGARLSLNQHHLQVQTLNVENLRNKELQGD